MQTIDRCSYCLCLHSLFVQIFHLFLLLFNDSMLRDPENILAFTFCRFKCTVCDSSMLAIGK